MPNPVGSLAPADGAPVPADKMFVQDMFPYPSGEGLHVGHPLGYIATDVYARYFRMNGRNVLHALGFDAFGLPAEQYAVQTGTHPRTRTEANIVNFRRQLGRLGLGHDARRSFATTDVDFYKWTQWIFLQIYNAWFDPDADRARPIAELIAEFDSGARALDDGRAWADAVGRRARRRRRLLPAGVPGRLDGQLVPGPGHRAGQRGGHVRRPQRPRQLPGVPEAVAAVDDAHHRLLRPAARRSRACWTGRTRSRPCSATGSAGPPARRCCSRTDAGDIEVFTTRPDTLFGATYMVLAPEHPLVDQLTAAQWPDGVDARWTYGARHPPRRSPPTAPSIAAKSDLERQENKAKTGVFLGSYATNPVNGERDPGVHRRLRAGRATAPARSWRCPAATSVTGTSPRSSGCRSSKSLRAATSRRPRTTATARWSNSDYLNGLSVASAKEAITARLEADGRGQAARRVQAAGLVVRPAAVLG